MNNYKKNFFKFKNNSNAKLTHLLSHQIISAAPSQIDQLRKQWTDA